MNQNTHDIADRDVRHDTLVAQLTGAAYEVALRHGVAGTWLELELDLWHALEVTASRFKAIPTGSAIEQTALNAGDLGGTCTCPTGPQPGFHSLGKASPRSQ